MITTVVFGSQRIAAIWTLRNRVDPNKVMLATAGAERLRGAKGPVTVVRVSEEAWAPPTHACEQRVREVVERLKDMKQQGVEIKEEVME